jgi:hypothetical protein
MVLTNTSPNSLNGDFHAVPSVHVTNTARTAILAYIASTGTAATAAIVPVNPGESSTQVPEVTAFSSRGPSTTTGGDILKPDIAAPGNDVLAAVAPPFNHGRTYDFYSGTSMASPHIAGIGALIKAAHPTWSASRVKSALMTTARDHATSADPFAQGAGFVQPNKAVDPGLTFDATATDWRRYLVGLGVQFAPPFDTLTALSGTDLNQASIAIGALAGRQSVTRTVTNVSGSSETYSVSASVPGLDITATPSSFTLAPGASQAVTFDVVRDTAAIGEWAKGNVTFTSSSHVVRVPLVAKPVAIAAPAEISGTGTSGSTSYSVTPGFTGLLTTTVAGLTGAAPTNDTVVNGAFSTTSPTPSAATKAYELVVPAGTTVARFDVDAASGLDDLDLYVYKGGTLVAMSASAAGDEQVTLTDPEAGTYTAYVNGYDTASGGGNYAYTQWAVPATDAGNLVVTGGGAVTLGTPTTLTATWSGLDATKRYLGWIGYGGADERTLVSIG